MWHTGATYIDDAQGIFYMGYREAPDYRDLMLELANGLCDYARAFQNITAGIVETFQDRFWIAEVESMTEDNLVCHAIMFLTWEHP